MPDDVLIDTLSSNPTVATDLIGGSVHHQRVKVQYGVDGSATDVSATNPMPVTAPAASPVPVTDFFTEVSKGNITGHSIVNKFGSAEDIDTGTATTLWAGKSAVGNAPDADLTVQSASFTAYLSSDAAGDTQSYEVQGLDASGDEQTQTVTATGTTPVAVTGTWTIVHRVKNKGSTDNAGIIFVNAENNHTAGVPDDSTKTVAVITAGENQTLQCLYKVPTGKTAYLIRWYRSCGKDDDIRFRFQAKPTGEVWQIKDDQYVYEQDAETNYRGMPSYPAGTLLRITAVAVTTTNKPAGGGFDLLLVDD